MMMMRIPHLCTSDPRYDESRQTLFWKKGHVPDGLFLLAELAVACTFKTIIVSCPLSDMVDEGDALLMKALGQQAGSRQ